MLKTQQFIENKLLAAEYKFDESVKEWVGWIENFPGIYAQGKTIELVRNELAETLEEYLFISIQEGKEFQRFGIKSYVHAKNHKP